MISAEELEKMMKKEYRGFLVVVEGGVNRDLCTPLLGRAREYGDMVGARVSALYLSGDDPERLIKLGADTVYYTDAEDAVKGNVETVTKLVVDLARRDMYEAIWFSSTHLGNSVAPRVAAQLGTEAIIDAVGVDMDLTERRLHVTRKLLGGQILEVVKFSDLPQVVTFVPGLFPEPFPDEFRYGRVEKLGEVPAAASTRVGETRGETPAPDVILVGGIELGSKENFEKLVRLGEKLNARVAATRMAVEMGIADRKYLLEIAGREPRARVYVAFGVYGTPVQARFARKSDIVVTVTGSESNPMLSVGHYNFVTDPVALLDKLLQK